MPVEGRPGELLRARGHVGVGDLEADTGRYADGLGAESRREARPDFERKGEIDGLGRERFFFIENVDEVDTLDVVVEDDALLE